MTDHLNVGAGAPGPVTPAESDEPAELGSRGGFREQGTTDNRDCAEAAAVCKRTATVQARLALAGWALTRAEDWTHKEADKQQAQNRTGDGGGAFLASRWGMVRELPDLAAVEDFAKRVGAPQ